jgi:uncharacterized protein YidB (DUF937 family)
MGLLDSVTSMMGSGGNSNAIGAVLEMLNGHQGGLGGLVGQFAQNGMGDIMNSWLGQGQNLPVSPDQLQKIFTSGQLSGLAQKMGVDPSQVTGQLSGLLPNIIDKLSPQGTLPQGNDWMSMAAGVLSSLMK